jgi:hypothetical protein
MLLFKPFTFLRDVRTRASVQHPPPPTRIKKDRKFGEYTVKVTVETTDFKGGLDQTFIGYSSNMDIVMKTEFACERLKNNGSTCGDSVMTIRGGKCEEEVVMMKNKFGTITRVQ